MQKEIDNMHIANKNINMKTLLYCDEDTSK